MPINPLEDALDQIGSTPKDSFDHAIDRLWGPSHVEVKQAVKQAPTAAPEQAAEIRRLSLKFGEPFGIVERNVDVFKKRESLALPYDQIQQQTPSFAEWLKQPTNVAIARDDMEHLGNLEWILKAWPRAIEQNLGQIRYSQLRFREAILGQTLTQDERDLMNAQKFHSEQGGALGAGNSWFRQAVTGAGQLVAQAWTPLQTAARAAGPGFAAGLMAGNPLAGAAVGAGLGAMFGAVKSTAEQESVQAYDELGAMRDEFGQPLDPGVRRVASLIVGGLNGLIEVGELKLATKAIPGLDRLKGVMSRRAVTAALRSPTFRGALFDFAKLYATQLGGETAQEVLQRLVALGGEEFTKFIGTMPAPKTLPTLTGDVPGQTSAKPRTGGQLAQELLSEAASAATSFALGVLPGPALGLVHTAARAVRAQQNVALFEALGEGVSQTKTLERAPAAMQEFLEAATKGGPVSNLYAPIDTWAQYWQGKGLDPAEVAAQVTGDPKAYETAVTTGEDLKIPTARYAVKLAGTEHHAALASELRLGPEEMNAREAIAFEQVLEARTEQLKGAPLSPFAVQVQQRLIAANAPTHVAEAYARLYDLSALEERAGFDPTTGVGVDVVRTTAAEWDQGTIRQPPAPTATTPTIETPVTTDATNVDGTPAVDATPATDAAGTTPAVQPIVDNTVAAGDTKAATDVQTKAATTVAVSGAVTGDPGVNAGIGSTPAVATAPGPGASESAGQGGRLRDRGIAASAPRIVETRSKAGNVSVRHETEQQRETRRTEHYWAVFEDLAAAARALDPTVNLSDLHAEFQFRIATYHELKQLEDESGHNPTVLLKAIASYGGLFEKASGNAGELADLKSGTKFGAARGVAGVFRKREVDHRGVPIKGLPFDLMVQRLQEDPRFSWLEDVNMLMDAIDDAIRHPAEADTFPGTYELRRAVNILAEETWWTPAWRPNADLLAENDAVSDEDLLGDVDTSFNVDEFDQGLFDEPPPSTDDLTGVDTLATGEQQPRLPGAGAVREQNIATPEVADLPFALTSETAKPKAGRKTEAGPSARYLEAKAAADTASAAYAEASKAYRARTIDDATFLEARRQNDLATEAFDLAFDQEQRTGGKTTLFQPLEPLTEEALRAFEVDLRERHGEDLASFNVTLSQRDDAIHLVTLAVKRGAQRAGLGSTVMRELTRFADVAGKRITLSVAERNSAWGTTSRGRLVTFYKRFGFVENKGRHKDFTISDGMYREPKLSTLDQPLFHGSPHDFERFSLEHVGTGEGAAAYGWGLYFAENPAVAGGYHDRLSGGKSVLKIKLGAMRISQAKGWDYTRNAHVNTVENVRASLAEDLLIAEAEMIGRGEGQFAALVDEKLQEKLDDYETQGYKEGIDAVAALRKEFARPGSLAVEFEEAHGGVYQVDIADEHIEKMLDWDAPISTQSDAIRNNPLILDLQTAEHFGYELPEFRALPKKTQKELRAKTPQGKKITASGEQLYAALVNNFQDNAMEASKALAAAGIPGLRYLDADSRGAAVTYDVGSPRPDFGPYSHFTVKGEAEAQLEILRRAGFDDAEIKTTTAKQTRNVVVFDDSIITLTHKDGTPFTPAERKEFFQPDETPAKPAAAKRGAIRFGPDRQFIIALLERADLSTFLHETGHFYLELFGDVADKLKALDPTGRTDSQNKIVADYQALLEHLGVTDRTQLDVAQHEQFARTFEAYLMTGEAPSLALRSTFARFRAWLTGIYRVLTSLNVQLTPEVKGILDRLIASDREIADATAAGSVAPMFLTAEQAHMTEAEFAYYRSTVTEASTRAREQLDAKLLAEVHREQTAEWKARREAIAATVTDEVQQLPVFRALAAIQRGTLADGSPMVEGQETAPLKLSKQAIVDRYGKERLKRLPRPYVYTVDDGLDPDHVAALFGFSSGDALLTALEEAPAMRQAIENETDRRMLAEHGSLLLDGGAHDAARLAISNEDRELVLREELRALAKMKKTVQKPALDAANKERAYERRWMDAENKLKIAIAEGRKQAEIDALEQEVKDLKATARGGAATIRAALPPAGAMSAIAATRIGRTRIIDLEPAQFFAAARRAAEQALDRAARQDFDGAIVAKQQEMFHVALFRQAEQLKVDIDARVKAARNLAGGPTRARIGKAGEGYLDQIDGILDRYDLAAVSKKGLERRANLRAWAAGLEAQGMPVDLSDELLDDIRRLNYRELTVDEFLGVTDGLKHIAYLAGLQNKLLKAIDARDYGETRDGVVDSIRSNTASRKAPLEFRPSDQKWRAAGEWFASHRKLSDILQRMDGYVDGGPVWSALMAPINAAADAEATRKGAAGRALWDLVVAAYPGRELGRLGHLLHIPEIGASLSKEARLAVALNWGNETSRDRLLLDPVRKWNEGQIQAILATLDKRDWDFVQATWDHINTYWQEIVDKQERVTGLRPEKVEAVPVQTAFGTYAGGYYPLMYDGRLHVRAAQNEAASQAKLGTMAAYVRSTTKRGHVEARKQNVRLPIRLELGVAGQHLEQVIHDLTHHEMLIDVTRLVRDPKVSQAILDTHGDIIYQQITRALQDIAIGATPAAHTMMDRAANFARIGTQIAGLGLNLWTGLQQPLGMFNGAARVGPKWVARGLGRWLRDAASLENTVTWIHSVSPMMRERATTGSQDLSDLRRAFSQPGGWFDDIVRTVSGDHVTKQTFTEGFLWHIGKMQQIADVPTWLGQYEKSMAAGESEARAIAIADQAVLDAQGGGQVKDLAQVQRGGPVARLFMTFYSYGNTVYNATARAKGQTSAKSPASVVKFLGHLGLIYFMPALATVALKYATGKNDDDGEKFLEDVGSELLSTALNTMVLVRELQGLAREGVRGYGGPAGTRAFSLIYNMAKQVEQGKVDEALVESVNALGGVLFRYPAAQVQRTIDGWVALEEGRSQNPLVLLVGPPPKKAAGQ